MTKSRLLLTLCLCIAMLSNAQTFSLKGTLADSIEHSNLKNGVVALLGKDSILQYFTRVDAAGKFAIEKVKPGGYILLVTHPGFADYVDMMEVDGDTNLDSIYMLSKAVLLQDVVVHGSPIRMKGDTLAYMADSFKVKDGATVEDLLKTLPGMQVNSKGEITSNGRRVDKVLVDGDEFFGDDPTLATQNMIAKAVKEVQVFDKKSDQAAFTGVDDGNSKTTINLKLKDEYKKGYFGKLKLADGLPNTWENSGMINAFKDKRKLSFYGKMSNTANAGLNFQEESSYGGESSYETGTTSDGMMYISNNDDFGYGASQGLPKSWMGGTSYSNKWNEDRNSILGAYRFQKQNNSGTTTTNTQTILDDTLLYRNDKVKSDVSKWRHKANTKSDLFIDSSSAVTITARGDYGENTSFNEQSSESLRSVGDSAASPLNDNEQVSRSKGNQTNFSASALYKKKFKKPSRTLSVNLSTRYAMNNNEGFQYSSLRYYDKGSFIRKDTIDQKKLDDNNSLSLDGKAAYTEPIGKRSIVELSYAYGLNNAEQERLTYDKVGGKYTELNDTLSNDYRFNTNKQQVGLAYRYDYKKIQFSFGSDVAYSKWKQTDLFTDTVRRYNFTNFFPRALFSYKFSQYSRIQFNYTGSTQAPSINQLQPVANNNDPLNVTIGNPELKQSFRQSFNLYANTYQVLNKQSFSISAYFQPVSNAFSTKNWVDTLGKRIYQTVNVDGNFNLSGSLSYSRGIGKSGANIGIYVRPSWNRNNNFVNGKPNRTDAKNITFSIYAYQYKDKKFTVEFEPSATYTNSKSSIQAITTKYWTMALYGYAEVYLPKDFQIMTRATYNWRQKTEFSTTTIMCFFGMPPLKKES